MGDNTNYVITIAGELLNQAAELIKSGLKTPEILTGYEKAVKKCLSLLDEAPKHTVKDVKNIEEVAKVIKPVIGSKLLQSQEIILAPLIAHACISVLPSNIESFNTENVRVAKILGGSLIDSHVIKGLVVARAIEGSVTSVEVK
jgi:T-complex protein 1 subunit theta